MNDIKVARIVSSALRNISANRANCGLIASASGFEILATALSTHVAEAEVVEPAAYAIRNIANDGTTVPPLRE